MESKDSVISEIKPKKGFTCDICNYVTYDKSNYNKHRKRHGNPRSFLYKNDLESQIDSNLDSSLNTKDCDPDNESLELRLLEKQKLESLNVPLNKGEKISSTSCSSQSNVNEDSESSSYLQKERTSFEKSAVFSFSTKSQTFINYPSLCEQCGKSFGSKSSLTSHIRKTHMKMFKFLCPDCGKGLHTEKKFTVHMAKHEERKKSVCTFCKKEFQNHTTLKQHLKVCEELDKDLHLCEICQATFANSVRLQSHIKGMHGEPRFACTFCEKKFKWRSSLSSHLLHSHRNQKAD